jgi:hypothetical protein
MDSITLNTVADRVRILPIRAMQIINESGVYFKAYHLEEESSMNIDAKTVNHFLSGVVQLGFNIDATIIIPHNQYEDADGIIDFLKTCLNKRLQTHLFFGLSAPYYTAPLTIPPTTANCIHGLVADFEKLLTITYSINTVALRPRTTVKLNGFVKDLKLLPATVYSDSESEMFNDAYPHVL